LSIHTKILTAVLPRNKEAISEAAGVMRRGGLVAFPSETVYGLGADAFNENAVRKVFEVKGRPPDNPVIVHVSEIAQFLEIGKDIPPVAIVLAETFWPGPLTLVVKHRGQLPDAVTAGLLTVAIRMPDHPVPLALIESLARGIIGPSANLSGRPSPTTAKHVMDDLNGKVEIILDGGPTRIGVESTVLDLTSNPPAILRPGGLPHEAIRKVIGKISEPSADALRRSPGTRYRHYAPRGQVILLPTGDTKFFGDLIDRLRREGKRMGCILHTLSAAPAVDLVVVSKRAEEYASALYFTMRDFDDRALDVILVESIPEIGVGEAVMDRLRRAAEPG
jgi:L-threonylcarbamoyladenylate synthase